ncbi:MAG: hypothetical protein GXP42_14575 [Chloroflexi bacterium]|nr:hypothetical protein [Chloroflexota bacterium]
MSAALYVMGWREILERVFEGFEAQRDASPTWLINPATKRRLKLDFLYPEIGLAVRFAGLQARGMRRKDDWQELEDAARDEVRKELCRLNNVNLVLISPLDAYPSEQFKALGYALNDASRRVARSRSMRNRGELMERLSQARTRLNDIRRKVKRPEDLAAYAELWRDREARILAEIQKPRPEPNGGRKKPLRTFKEGQWIEHERFGRGQIVAVDPSDGDVQLTIHFVTAGERRFLGSLVADKLRRV